MSQVLHKSLMDVHSRELADLVAAAPALPAAPLALLRRMRDPDATVPEIAEALAHDQELADKVLHVVNCAFGGEGGIRTISRAVVILGFRAVRSAVLAVCVLEYFKPDADDGTEWREFWRHSLTVAVASRVLALELRFKQPEEAFLVGLLHDIGKLVERRHYRRDFDEACTVAQEQHFSWLQCEKALFQVNHATIGEALCQAWDFPAGIVDAIVNHHEPSVSTQVPQLTALVHVADLVAYELDAGSPGAWGPAETDPSALQLLGLEPAELSPHHARIRAELATAQPLLELLC